MLHKSTTNYRNIIDTYDDSEVYLSQIQNIKIAYQYDCSG